jgi:hypothetical protein
LFGGIYPLAKEEIGTSGKYQYQQKPTAGFEIKKQTDKKQEGIAEQNFIVKHGKECHHNSKKRPKIELSKQQRLCLVESEDSLKKCRQITPFHLTDVLNVFRILSTSH